MRLSINKSRGLWWTVSCTIILAGIISMVISWQQIGAPLRPGLDFIGGTRLQFERDCTKPGNCERAIDVNVVREVARTQGLGDSSIQVIADKETRKENGVLIRTKALTPAQRTQLQNAISEKIGAFDPQKNQIDTVGPSVGQDLFRSGVIALIVSFIGITVYMAFRFKLDYAIFAIVALFHDILITVGIFSILGLVAQIEVDSLFIVALLTITGFSVNDTVVIYDRIRETVKTNPNRSIAEIVDDAVNQTLSRSINTTLPVLLTLFSLFLFGGETLRNFALALIVGFTMGAYSSIFIASTLLCLWREYKGESVLPNRAESIDASIDS